MTSLYLLRNGWVGRFDKKENDSLWMASLQYTSQEICFLIAPLLSAHIYLALIKECIYCLSIIFSTNHKNHFMMTSPFAVIGPFMPMRTVPWLTNFLFIISRVELMWFSIVFSPILSKSVLWFYFILYSINFLFAKSCKVTVVYKKYADKNKRLSIFVNEVLLHL